jgi:two-component system, NarL family, nitrate/nitrite response regulator NarL
MKDNRGNGREIITHLDRGKGQAIAGQVFWENLLYRMIPPEGRSMNKRTTNVVLADDHPRVRAGIRNLLQNTPDIVVVGEAEDGVEAITLVEELSPDVLVVDMEMPHLNGNEVADRLRKKGSNVRILALSAHDDRHYIMGMFKSGAAGYLTKDDVPEVLVKAIRGIARGEEGWVSKRVAVKISKGNENLEKLKFTPLEKNILKAIGDKNTNEDIAKKLGIEQLGGRTAG